MSWILFVILAVFIPAPLYRKLLGNAVSIIGCFVMLFFLGWFLEDVAHLTFWPMFVICLTAAVLYFIWVTKIGL